MGNGIMQTKANIMNLSEKHLTWLTQGIFILENNDQYLNVIKTGEHTKHKLCTK